jgi:hypothetical protein
MRKSSANEGEEKMKNALLLLFLGTFLLATPRASSPRAKTAQAAPAQTGAAQGTPQGGMAQGDRKPVVVELFTSEGCSSCPPADALLKKVETEQPIRDAEVIVLEEHVDYWNQGGWFDPYSSPEWTQRQQEYVSKLKGQGAYTPQMVVDGQREFVGNSIRDAGTAIHEAAQRAKAEITITPEASVQGDTQHFDVKVAKLADTESKEDADIWLAITEDGLVGDVKAGENAGKSLQHAAILRSFHKIGGVSSGKESSPFEANPEVKFKSNWKKENLRVVVLVQGHKSLRILGAASARLAG